MDPNLNQCLSIFGKNNSFPQSLIKDICNYNYGVGSDGVIFGPIFEKHKSGDYLCRICMHNPDGSQFSKSGNGLRIFFKYFYDNYHKKFQIELKPNKPFTIMSNKNESIIGGRIIINPTNEKIQNKKDEKSPITSNVEIDIGEAAFDWKSIPLSKPLFNNDINCFKLDLSSLINGETGRINCYCVNTGNPHCIILIDDLIPFILKNKHKNKTKLVHNFNHFKNLQNESLLSNKQLKHLREELISLLKQIGPKIENNISIFPQRTNVQFMKRWNKSSNMTCTANDASNDIEILIWERGVGYTLSSGTSSCANASLAYKLGWFGKNCDSNTDTCDNGTRINVHCIGGVLKVHITDTLKENGRLFLKLWGPAQKIAQGTFWWDNTMLPKL